MFILQMAITSLKIMTFRCFKNLNETQSAQRPLVKQLTRETTLLYNGHPLTRPSHDKPQFDILLSPLIRPFSREATPLYSGLSPMWLFSREAILLYSGPSLIRPLFREATLLYPIPSLIKFLSQEDIPQYSGPLLIRPLSKRKD